MKERYIVTYAHDDYAHYREHTEDGFETFDDALTYAKANARCVDHGRMVCFDAKINKVTEVTNVYQRRNADAHTYAIEAEA